MAKLHPRSAAVLIVNIMLCLVINSSPVFLAKIYIGSILAPLVSRRKPLVLSPFVPRRQAVKVGSDTPYRSGPSRTWIIVRNPKAPAATRAIDGPSNGQIDPIEKARGPAGLAGAPDMKRAGRHGKIRCFIPSRSFQRLIRNFVSEQVFFVRCGNKRHHCYDLR